jgi:hypothetical protein
MSRIPTGEPPIVYRVIPSPFQQFALRLAPLGASVANYCDHVEHNEFADRDWVLASASELREAAGELAERFGLNMVELYAERVGEIEARNVLARPDGYDGHRAALEARTWRELQLVQCDHDRHYHPDVVGMAKDQQLQHYALHLAKAVGAFAEPRTEEELLHRRLPDVLLFAIKLPTVMGVRLPDEALPRATSTAAVPAAALTAS